MNIYVFMSIHISHPLPKVEEVSVKMASDEFAKHGVSFSSSTVAFDEDIADRATRGCFAARGSVVN